MGVNIEGSPPHTQFVCASAHAGKGRKEEKDRRCTPLTLRGNYDRFIQDMYVKRERAHDDDEEATGREKEFPTPLSSSLSFPREEEEEERQEGELIRPSPSSPPSTSSFECVRGRRGRAGRGALTFIPVVAVSSLRLDWKSISLNSEREETPSSSAIPTV